MGRFRASTSEIVYYDVQITYDRLGLLGMDHRSAHSLALKMQEQHRADAAAKWLAEGKTLRLGLDSREGE